MQNGCVIGGSDAVMKISAVAAESWDGDAAEDLVEAFLRRNSAKVSGTSAALEVQPFQDITTQGGLK